VDELRTDTQESPIDEPEESAGRPRSRGLRGWAIALTLFPAALCGLTYLALVEYALAGRSDISDGSLGLLRAGGLGLVALTTILAAACGHVLSERFTRPVRLLLRLAETGELPQGQAAFTHGPQWEVFELYRRVGALVHQNQSGARAIQELERTRIALAALQRVLARPGQHGLIAELPPDDESSLVEIVQPLAANRARLVQFFAELRERVGVARNQLERLGEAAGWDRDEESFSDELVSPAIPRVPAVVLEESPKAPALAALGPSAYESLSRVRRVGTVLALESERLAGPNGDEIGGWFARFEAEVDAAERQLEQFVTLQLGPGPNPSDAARAELALTWRETREALATIETRLAEMESR